jgi:hypothetical protein
MPTATLRRQIARLEVAAGQRRRAEHPALRTWRHDPARLMADSGLAPDPWEADVLSSPTQRMPWCENPDDDLVLATALALWDGEREPHWQGEVFAGRRLY